MVSLEGELHKMREWKFSLAVRLDMTMQVATFSCQLQV